MTAEDDYLNRRNLILGDVNAGKTLETLRIVTRWAEEGRSREISVLDLAPVAVQGIGGRLVLPEGFAGRYLFADIVPPRLTGRDASHITRLATANAQAIDPLLDAVLEAPRPILVINDVTLYLHAGDYGRLESILKTADTALINAYWGEGFVDHPISRRERRLTRRLIHDCDQVIRMPP
ncbi:MAG: hypothetical protein PVH30_03760 [Desulfobacterales bacterium]|jgi:hypothetical protein